MAWSENRKKAMEELERGRELANQLRDLLSKSLGDEGLMDSRSSSSNSEDLVMKIFDSFANTLSIFRNNNHNNIGDYDEVSQQNNNMSCRKSGHLAESIKSTTTSTTISASTRKNRKSDRKHVESYIWTRDTSALFDDGHTWRKYGQRVILNANHPRHYFRCTHKSDQGCQATKQVQKIQDDPPMYRTTYHGHHTCKNLLNAASLFILDSSIEDSSTLLSFANNNQLTNKHDSKEPMPTDITSCCNPSALPEHLLSPDHHLTMFEPPAQMTVLPADNQMDAISGVLEFVDLDFLLDF